MAPARVSSDVTVVILDRPRHAALIDEARAAGARVRLIADGDVGGAIETAKMDAPVDLMLGIGGARSSAPPSPAVSSPDLFMCCCRRSCC